MAAGRLERECGRRVSEVAQPCLRVLSRDEVWIGIACQQSEDSAVKSGAPCERPAERILHAYSRSRTNVHSSRLVSYKETSSCRTPNTQDERLGTRCRHVLTQVPQASVQELIRYATTVSATKALSEALA